MKTYLGIFVILFLTIELHSQYYQRTKCINESRLKYENFDKQGEYQKGRPVGKWLDISKQGVIYKEYTFDVNGKPCGIWSFNFPDGNIRKQVEFIDNKIIRIKRYHLGGGEFFEINLNQTIEDSIYQQFQDLEEELFYNENTSQKIKVEGYNARTLIFQYDPYLAITNFLNFFAVQNINCEIDLWNINGKLWRKWSNHNGEIIEIYYKYDKKNNLLSQTEYKDNIKMKKTKYNFDGSIKK